MADRVRQATAERVIPPCPAGLAANDPGRVPCEIWTRVMGYHRPVSAFNAGKRAEHAQRRYFVEGTHHA